MLSPECEVTEDSRRLGNRKGRLLESITWPPASPPPHRPPAKENVRQCVRACAKQGGPGVRPTSHPIDKPSGLAKVQPTGKRVTCRSPTAPASRVACRRACEHRGTDHSGLLGVSSQHLSKRLCHPSVGCVRAGCKLTMDRHRLKVALDLTRNGRGLRKLTESASWSSACMPDTSPGSASP